MTQVGGGGVMTQGGGEGVVTGGGGEGVVTQGGGGGAMTQGGGEGAMTQGGGGGVVTHSREAHLAVPQARSIRNSSLTVTPEGSFYREHRHPRSQQKHHHSTCTDSCIAC